MDLVGQIGEDFIESYMSGDFNAMKELVRLNHWALNGFGLSTTVINAIVEKGQDLGFNGKLTGGGSGGCCFFLLPKGEAAAELKAALKPYTAYSSQISSRGVVIY